MWNEKIEEILDFWFGDLPDDSYWPDGKAELWFKKDSNFDAEIKRRFEAPLNASLKGEIDDWLETPRGVLAFVVLLDQFSRNMYRDLPEEYAFDTLCISIVRRALKNGVDKGFHPVEQEFLYMPLMHSEVPEDQKLSIKYFTGLRDSSPEPLRKYFELTLDYALLHKTIIDRFGRYPYRNDQLGRDTTVEEDEFLKMPGSRF